MEYLEKHATKKQRKAAALKHHRIGSFVDGKITREELARLLSCSLNHTYPLVRRYDRTDEYQYLNKKIGKTINQKVTPEVEEKIINGFLKLIKDFENCKIYVEGRPKVWFERPTYSLYYSLIKKWCDLSITTVVNILKSVQLWSSRSRKTLAHRSISISDPNRYAMAGEEVQMDAKVGIKFPDDDFACVVHTAVDAKTNSFIGMYFDFQETNFGYLKILEYTFRTYGVARRYVTDNRSSFTTNREVGDKNVIIAKGIKQLKAELITTSNAKRKNKVESKNDVIQMRIVQMLMIMNIRTMEMANLVIEEVMQAVNEDLGNVIGLNNCFAKFPKEQSFEELFSTEEQRKIKKYSQIQIDNNQYFAVTQTGKVKYLHKGCSATLIRYYNGEMKLKYNGSIYSLVLATSSNLRKYKVSYEYTKVSNYRSNRNHFIFNQKEFHIVDLDGTLVSIKAGDRVEKIFDNTGTLLYVMLNKVKYSIAEGIPQNPTDTEPELSISQVSMKYDGTFTFKGNKYELMAYGSHVVFADGTKLDIFCENGIPTHLEHEKKMITCHDLSISPLKVHRPTSKYVARSYWPKCKNVIYFQD